jgi:AcrR family transcriptional regulator
MKPHYHSEIRDAERERHHFAILRAAMDVFSEQGYHAAKLDDIAVRAGMSKGSIYNHFECKKDLFLSVIEWGEYQLLHQIKEARRRSTDVRDSIENTLRTFFRFFEKRESFFKVLIQEKYNFHEEVKVQFMRLLEVNLKETEADIRKGIKEGIIRDIDPQICVLILNSIANGLFFNWMHMKSKFRMVDMFNSANDFIKNGIYIRDTGSV